MEAAQVTGHARRLGIGDVGRPVPLKPGLGGNELWRLRRDRSGAGDLVLRLFPVGADDALADRESAAHAVAAAHGVPTPRIVGQDRLDDRPVLAMEWVRGPLVSEALWTGSDPERLGRRCGELLATLHRITAAEVDRTLRIANLPNVLVERDWIDWSGPRAADLRPVLAGLDDHRLLHLDFHPENLVLAGDDIVVLDWANTRLGPASADLARTASIIDLIRDGGHPDIGAAQQIAMITFGDGLVAGYAAAAAEPQVPAVVRAWAAAVQLVDLTASWVTPAYQDRLRQRYLNALPNRP
ncbi:phosphotransferase family protein [Microlunatus soli]|uniref:Predicted kinase, aminoglycoside phosphotransferase (APT) family n=1 Tax=Microlunatus soli TaxID=630515 RepID=A0A1H1SCL3_9ACTN|nr:phosphotransferase [Microlunatus soli]SDS45682.1 Predicted kinase, aminoglycoside phosphotransferase (APT) family [Microlunatus soli]